MMFLIKKTQGERSKKWRTSVGFTLIELVAVIVILSILATIGTGFVVKTTEAYQRTQTRALLVNTARQSIERMTRQLRGALPYSVRPTNNGSCIEFMPIAGGGNYFDPVPDVGNQAPDASTIEASPPQVAFGTPRHITIGAMSNVEIYGSNPTSRATYVGYDQATNVLSFNPAMGWQRNSISKRYYLLDHPQAFCVIGNELRFYEGISVADENVDVSSVHSILARNIILNTPFALTAGSGNRHTGIIISLDFSNAGETINYTHQVLIRNVP